MQAFFQLFFIFILSFYLATISYSKILSPHMQIDDVENRIIQLRREIARHEHLYRIEHTPAISDDDFDLLMRELRTLEERYPQFASDSSPSARVGSDLDAGFESVAHLSPMLSLDNVFNTAELAEFDARLHKILGIDGDFVYSVEPKIDGAGISAIYKNGRLERLLTRGDGERGDDITRNRSVFSNIPQTLSGSGIPELLEIRGEAYMTRSEFDRLSKLAVEAEKLKLENRQKSPLTPEQVSEMERKRPYANPRNLAAGTLKLLDAEVLSQRKLEAVFYSVGASKGFELKRQSDLPQRLAKLGLPSVNWRETAVGTAQAFEKICALEEVRNDFPFNTDGAVLKLDDCSLHADAGWTSHAPRWAIAWKYRAERVATKVLAITLQVGRTGAVTPVAELEPVYVSGSTVSRATLHNANYIAQKDIRVGDSVIVEKAGEIIPAVLGVADADRTGRGAPFTFPNVCPECGSPLKVYGEKMLARCPNFSCPPQVKGRIEHFASRDCMDIKGLGGAVVANLVDRLGVKSPADLYSLTKRRLLSLDKFRDKSAENLLESIEKSKSQDLGRLIFGLGILEIGERYAKELASRFGSIDALMNAELSEIMAIEGLGKSSLTARGNAQQQSVRALSIRAFFDDPHNREMIEQLRAAGLNFKAQISASENFFTGRLFVLTGTLKAMDRNDAKRRIEALGGKIGSSVTKQTDYLISDGETEGSKAKKAAALGTKIILEDEFLARLAEAESGSASGAKTGGESDGANSDAGGGSADAKISDVSDADAQPDNAVNGSVPDAARKASAGNADVPQGMGEDGAGAEERPQGGSAKSGKNGSQMSFDF